MNRSPDEIIDALAFALENGGVSTVLIGDNEAARLVTSWRETKEELWCLDELLARRPAISQIIGRHAKIQHALRVAAKAEP